MWHIIITVGWPGDVALQRCHWWALVWSCAVGYVRMMVVEGGSGCWRQAALCVVGGRGWWWLGDNHCLLLITQQQL